MTSTAAQSALLPDVDDVVRLCAEVIGVASLSLESNFFDAGGDSITAARLAVLLEEEWNAPVDVFAIMAAEDLREIHGGLLDSVLATHRRDAVPPRPPGALMPSLNQEVRLRMDAEVADTLGRRHTHTLALAFRSTEVIDPDRLRRALRSVALRHEPLRSVFPSPAEVVVLDDVTPDLAVREIESCADASLREVVEQHAATAFDLAAAPPWSVLLLRHQDHCQVVSLTLDHLLADGESVEILLRDLADAYDEDAPLAPMRPSYYDWAHWQRAAQLPVALDHAAGLVDDANPGQALLPELRLTIQEQLGPSALGLARHTLPPRPVRALAEVAAELGGTLFQALLLCYGAVVDRVRVPGRSGMVISVSNRARAETRDMFGWVANMVFLPLHLDESASVTDGLANVHAALAGIGEISTVPVRVLQEHLWRGDSSISRFPGVFVEFRKESPVDLEAWGGRWRRVKLETPIFLLPGLSLWLRQRLDGSLDMTLGYDRGQLSTARARALLGDVASAVDDAVVPERLLGTLGNQQ